MYRTETACFTGHRPEKLPWGSDESDPRCYALKERLGDIVEALYASGIRHFICGMARGCDTYFCEAVIALREEREDVTLEAAIPFDGQSGKWSAQDRKRYYYLTAQCDRETVLQHGYSKDCFLRRNQYMVDSSSVLVAVFDGTAGGTSQTVSYASREGLEVISINPYELYTKP